MPERAEIEAARAALGRVDAVRVSFEGMEAAIAALDAERARVWRETGYDANADVRVDAILDHIRDARGDDEAAPRVEGDSRTVAQWLYAKAERFGLMSDSLGYANAGRDAIRKIAREWQDEFPSDRRLPVRSPQSNPYPWLTIYPDGHMECDMIETTAVEADRRLVIMQELQAGRLKIAGGLGQ
jgi:hypothetical protein